jgi:hypothetical protein
MFSPDVLSNSEPNFRKGPETEIQTDIILPCRAMSRGTRFAAGENSYEFPKGIQTFWDARSHAPMERNQLQQVASWLGPIFEAAS